MASIRFLGITKIYQGGVTAVNNFNLEINDREFIVLVGPSGCGKSTLLRMIAGLEAITSGEIYIGEKEVGSIAPKKRDIAMVFQNYALYPHMRVYDNMAYALKLRHVKKKEIRRRVIETAETLEIKELLRRKPKALSGGQRQRVALGRAMVRDPAVFLLDEPLSNLDAKLRASMRAEIRKLHRKLNATFVYVTHDQTEAMTMGDRIVVMKDGIIQQADTPQNLYNSPANLFVAGFIGTPQMNFFKAKLSEENPGMLEIGDRLLKLSEEDAVRAADFIGHDIILGVRPEDIVPNEEQRVDDGISPAEEIPAIIENREMMGNEAFLYMQYNGTQVISRVNPNAKAKEDDAVNLKINMEKVHLFDKETEQRI